MTKISIKQAVSILKRYNKWRRGANIAQQNPRMIGVAIDALIEQCDDETGLERALNAVCKTHKLKKTDVKGISRVRKVSDARNMFCGIASNDYSVSQIARYLHRNHTTIISSISQNTGLTQTYDDYRLKYEKCLAIYNDYAPDRDIKESAAIEIFEDFLSLLKHDKKITEKERQKYSYEYCSQLENLLNEL